MCGTLNTSHCSQTLRVNHRDERRAYDWFKEYETGSRNMTRLGTRQYICVVREPSPGQATLSQILYFCTGSHSVLDLILYWIPFCTGSHSAPDPILHRIPFCTGSHSVPDPILYWIPFCTGSHSAPDPILHRFPFCTGSHSIPPPGLESLIP